MKSGHGSQRPAQVKCTGRGLEKTGGWAGSLVWRWFTCHAIRSLSRFSLSWSSGWSLVYSSVKKAWGGQTGIWGFLFLPCGPSCLALREDST